MHAGCTQTRSAVEEDSKEPLRFLKGMFMEGLALEESCTG